MEENKEFVRNLFEEKYAILIIEVRTGLVNAIQEGNSAFDIIVPEEDRLVWGFLRSYFKDLSFSYNEYVTYNCKVTIDPEKYYET